MAEFVEVMKEKLRMCKFCKCYEEVGNCPIEYGHNGRELNCESFVHTYPQDAEELILDWAKKHPNKYK